MIKFITMNNRVTLTLKYALAFEIFFTVICGFLIGIEFFWGSGSISLKGALYGFGVIQVPVIVIVVRHWHRLGNDDISN